MNVNINKCNDILNVLLEGRLDTTTAPALESLLEAHYEGVKTLIFDCEKLSYISSAGLRVLLTAHKRLKGGMKLTNVNELVMEVLEVTGFSDIWVIA